MEDIHIGDKVFTRDYGYEPIYGFGHYAKDKVVEFLEIHTEDDDKNSFWVSIKITRDHMIYVNYSFTPAKNIMVGDILIGNDG